LGQKQLELNFGQLSIETREFIKAKEFSIKARTSQTIWENGRDLLEVKERLEHGQFQKWVESRFPWSYRTAKDMMNVAETFKSAIVADLEIQTKALYLLAAPSTPQSAREKAIEKAEQGETITHKEAKELVAAHKTISSLERQIADLQSTLPKEDVLLRISNLEGQLVEARSKPEKVIEVIPESHEKLKKDNESYVGKVESMSGRIAKMSKKIDEFSDKQKEVDPISLLSDAHKAVSRARVLLDGIAIVKSEVVSNSLSSLKEIIGSFNMNPTIFEADFNEIRQIH